MAEVKTLLFIDRKYSTISPINDRSLITSSSEGIGAGLSDSDKADIEYEKREAIKDIAQFTLDLTGILDPTPLSDGTNALISLGRGNWVDAMISVVSIVPFVGDAAKLGKLSRYLDSIRKAINIAKKDGVWAIALIKLLKPLRKFLDQLIKLFDEPPKKLLQIKDEIDRFMPSTMDGAAPGGRIVNPKLDSANQVRKPRVDKLKDDSILEVNGTKNTDGIPDKVTRSDDNFPSKTTKKGVQKVHTDKDGNLHPANPDGKTTIPEHIRNHKDKKENSPHISTTAQDGNVKPREYGDGTVEIDTKRLQKDIDAGKVKDVEIVPPKKVQGQVQKKIDNAQNKYDANPTKKNSASLKNAKRDLKNTTRDNECIITVTGKGCIPSEYIKKAK